MSEIAIIEDGGILLEDGVIIAVGPSAEIAEMVREGDEVNDATGRVVTPGLVDAHTHFIFASNRASEFEMRCAGATYQEIAAAGGGILNSVSATRAATESELLEESQTHADWLRAHGTTTAEVKSGYGLSLESELKMLRVARQIKGIDVVPTFLGAHSIPPEFCDNPAGYLDLILNEILPAVVAENLAEYCDIFVEDRYFRAEDARTLLSRAQELGLGVRMHVDQLANSGGATLAASLQADTADHLEHTDQAGIEALARTWATEESRISGTFPVLLPGSVYALGHSRYPDARAMIAAGLPVVLATDFNPGSSPSPSLQFAMSLACTQMKMSPAEALVACTVNAAYSLNRGHDRATLEPGKRADIVIWDVADYREIAYWNKNSAWKVI